jgi:ppGpp synthetase/RelA/SpoT-type nucleotidyltranferase
MNQIKKLSYLRQARITEERFNEIGLNWDELNNIVKDYIKTEPALKKAGEYIANDLMSVDNVHSVRFRSKDPDHLIIKIIRKRHANPERIIVTDNYKTEITDLIGVRVIHLLKKQWMPINKYITKTWDLHEAPIAYIREGDPDAFFDMFKAEGFTIKKHDFGYRSLHYIIPTKPAKETFYAEIQLRTIFEEGWSEIDHKIRYPNNTENALYNEFLLILNRLAGSADEMGSFIMNLKSSLLEQRLDFKEKLREKDLIIKDLNSKIDKLQIAPKEKAELVESIKSLSPKYKTYLNDEVTNIFKALTDGLTGKPYESPLANPSGRHATGFIKSDQDDKDIA